MYGKKGGTEGVRETFNEVLVYMPSDSTPTLSINDDMSRL